MESCEENSPALTATPPAARILAGVTAFVAATAATYGAHSIGLGWLIFGLFTIGVFYVVWVGIDTLLTNAAPVESLDIPKNLSSADEVPELSLPELSPAEEEIRRKVTQELVWGHPVPEVMTMAEALASPDKPATVHYIELRTAQLAQEASQDGR